MRLFGVRRCSVMPPTDFTYQREFHSRLILEIVPYWIVVEIVTLYTRHWKLLPPDLLTKTRLHKEHRLLFKIPHKRHLNLRDSQHIVVLNLPLNHVTNLTLQQLILQEHLANDLPLLTHDIHLLRDSASRCAFLNDDWNEGFCETDGLGDLAEVDLLALVEVHEFEAEVLFGGLAEMEHEGLLPGEEFDVMDGLRATLL